MSNLNTFFPSVTGEILHPNKNYIINGGFQTHQKADNYTGSVFGYNSFDMWANNAGTTTQKYIYDDIPVLGLKGYDLLKTNLNIRTGIEFDNILPTVGKTYTLSYDVMSSGTDAYDSVLVRFRASVGNGTPTLIYTNVPDKEVPVGVWTKRTHTFTVTSTRLSGDNVFVWISFNNDSLFGSDIVYVRNVKLEDGSIATPFVIDSLSESLSKCQRYYWKGKMVGSHMFHYGGTGYTQMDGASIGFPVTMRATPTVSIVTNPGFSNCTMNSIYADIHGMFLKLDVTSAGKFRALNGVYDASAQL